MDCAFTSSWLFIWHLWCINYESGYIFLGPSPPCLRESYTSTDLTSILVLKAKHNTANTAPKAMSFITGVCWHGQQLPNCWPASRHTWIRLFTGVASGEYTTHDPVHVVDHACQMMSLYIIWRWSFHRLIRLHPTAPLYINCSRNVYHAPLCAVLGVVSFVGHLSDFIFLLDQFPSLPFRLVGRT